MSPEIEKENELRAFYESHACDQIARVLLDVYDLARGGALFAAATIIDGAAPAPGDVTRIIGDHYGERVRVILRAAIRDGETLGASVQRRASETLRARNAQERTR
jgi:hypothetical protein